MGPPLSQGLGNASPPPAIILLPGDRPRKKRNRAGLVSRQHDLSPPSLDIIGTQIVRHRELIARIKEEVVCGASWGHSCSARAIHYLLWGCVRAGPGLQAAPRLGTKGLSSQGTTRLQLAIGDERTPRSWLPSAPHARGEAPINSVLPMLPADWGARGSVCTSGSLHHLLPRGQCGAPVGPGSVGA